MKPESKLLFINNLIDGIHKDEVYATDDPNRVCVWMYEYSEMCKMWCLLCREYWDLESYRWAYMGGAETTPR